MTNIWDVLKIVGPENSPANMAWKTKGQGGFGAFGLMINELIKKDKDKDKKKKKDGNTEENKLSTADKLGHAADALKSFSSVMDPETTATPGIRYQSWM